MTQDNKKSSLEQYFADNIYAMRLNTLTNRFSRWLDGTGRNSDIIISCLGILGLASLLITKKTKEIGIRKIFGASIMKIFILLTNDFTKWILIANVLAWPVVWYAMNKWLQNFAYRVDITIWPFLLAGGATLVIALLTVSWQAIRAATANPVEALRYE